MLVKLGLLSWLVFLALSALLACSYYFKFDVLLIRLPPLFILLLIGSVFWRSLLPGNEPLVTGIGERARGPLGPKMRQYTLRVTQFWAGFISLQFTATLYFSIFGPEWLWVSVTSVFNYLLVGVLFVAEFYWRMHCFPDHDHPSFFNYIAIVTKANVKKH